MEHTNGSAGYGSPLPPYSAGMSASLNMGHISSTSSAVFPDFQNFTNLYTPYDDNSEPVNLTSTHSGRSDNSSQRKNSLSYSPAKAARKQPDSATGHSLNFSKEATQISLDNLSSTSHMQASPGVNLPTAGASQHLPTPVAQKLPFSQASTAVPSTQLFSPPLHRLMYNHSQNSLPQPANLQLPQKDFPPYYPNSKRTSKAARAPTSVGSESQHLPRNDTPQSDAGNLGFSFDQGPATAIGKVAIQPLKRMPTPTLPVRKTPKSKSVMANTYQLILPLPSATQTSSSSSIPPAGTHLASSSPAIQAALNRPVVERKRTSKKNMQSVEAVISSTPAPQMPTLQHAPAMLHHIAHSSLHDQLATQTAGKPVKPRKRSHKPKSDTSAKRGGPKAVDDRFVFAAPMPGEIMPTAVIPGAYIPSAPKFATNQLAVGASTGNTGLPSLPVSSDNLLIIQSKSIGSERKELMSSDHTSNDPSKLAKIEPRQGTELNPKPVKQERPEGPRSLLEMRQYNKCKESLTKISVGEGAANSSEATASSTGGAGNSAEASGTTALPDASTSAITSSKLGTPTNFDWISYLRTSSGKAAPQSAFKHLEASLVNGFQVGMKVETPLRGADTDKYWLATVVAVYGGVLKLRFDGYGDKSNDFTVACSSGQLHPIGWCSKNQKSLLPPADIRHTQRQWKSFLLNVLQGAKTVPTYLLSSHGCPWMADRIKQGMRLEVQHENLPTTVWVAKVIRNVGGRMKLRYEGSIDDATDFWLFYLDRRAHPCGWSAPPIIYKPPDEIKEAYDYEAWSSILQEVTSDSNIDRIPSEIFQLYPELPAHTFKVGQILEAVHPTGEFIGPACIVSVINSQYFIVEHISTGSGKGVTQCYYSRHPALFPVGWCGKNGVELGKPKGINNNQVDGEFSWTEYITTNSAVSAAISDFMNHVPVHQFSVGQKLEAVNPSKDSQICVATIIRIVERLMWLSIHITSTSTTTIIVDVTSHAIFPAGWCESNSYPLTAPLVVSQSVSQSIQSAEATHQHGELGPKLFFNHLCFSGPFLSKSRILELPESLGPGHIRLIVKEMLSLLLSVGYKSSYILRILQRTSSANPQYPTQIIKTKCKGKSYEGAVEVCTKRSELKSYCRQICRRLQCCPNLVSPDKVTGRCSERCDTMTKTQYLIMGSRKPGRPSTTNPDGTKKRKRRRRKKVFTPKRNLYIPNPEYTGAMSENGSGSSNSEEDLLPTASLQFTSASQQLSPSLKRSPTPRSRQSSTPSSRPPSAADDHRGNLPKDHPLYQLQLTSVKKDLPVAISTEPTPESHQYQIVKEKKKKGRPAKFASPETLQRSKSLNLSRYPTVPPLKIRRLELSPSLPVSTGCDLERDVDTADLMVVSSRAQSTTLPTSVTSGASTRLRVQQNSASHPDRLLRAAIPRNKPKSALSFTQPRLHINDSEKVVLTDNPLYWDVNRIQSFIKQTDCASLTDKLSAHEVDGQAFMMLVLPTIQEELGLKLGPALKLCHQVQRLKLAFYETFHPEDLVRSL